jgi:hypothetical protein
VTIKDQCKAIGLNYKTYCHRRHTCGWTHEDALNRPVQVHVKKKKFSTDNCPKNSPMFGLMKDLR